MKKIIAIIIILMSCFIFILLQDNTDLNDTTPNLNVISYGITNSNNEIIDTGSEIESNILYKEGVNLLFSQEISEERDYKILCLLDYRVVDFIIDEKIYKSYDFSLPKKGEFKKNIKFEKNQKGKELSIIIIRKPYIMVDKDDINRAIKTDDIINLRYKIKSVKEEYKKNKCDIKFEKIKLNKDLEFDLFVTKEDKDLKIITTASENTDYFLILGNKEQKNKSVAFIVLLDWEQIKINDKYVNFVDVPKKSYIYSKLKFPQIKKEESNFQILLFPKPYEIKEKDYKDLNVYGSTRIHLLKNNTP